MAGCATVDAPEAADQAPPSASPSATPVASPSPVPDGLAGLVLPRRVEASLSGPAADLTVRATVDTGGERSSVDAALVEELGLTADAGSIGVESASGSEDRELVELQVEVLGRMVMVVASVDDRSELTDPLRLGRDALAGAFVAPFTEDLDEAAAVTAPALPFRVTVTVIGPGGEVVRGATLDSGAQRTSIDDGLADLVDAEPTGETVRVRSSFGVEERPLVAVELLVGGVVRELVVSVADRDGLNDPVLVGRDALEGVLVAVPREGD